jgi:4-amino-4-deoxy-L-arabinose transferase-like glycosyltransferase
VYPIFVDLVAWGAKALVGIVVPIELGLPRFDIGDRFPQIHGGGVGTKEGSRRSRMRVDTRSKLGSVSRRWWPELVVGFLAGFIFLGFLGSLELWGKREQRASAETLDTVENGHWLVAEIQGRPRLEKPPLPRWTTAMLMTLTGRRDEWVVRLPCAFSALATVALVYLLGARIGGRGLALAAAMALSTMWLFIAELRQASNDGPLGLCTTLALYAAWCRMHGTARTSRSASEKPEDDLPGPRGWLLVFYLGLGLGFLCKGPIILLLVGLTVIPYLAAIGSLGMGLRRLADRAGFLTFLGLALSWPVPVLLRDPNALGVWMMEIGQKTGMLPIIHQNRSILGLALPVLVLPWPVAALTGVVLPLVRNRRVRLPWRSGAVWFPWCWAVVNLAMFSTWAVAKPNYYIPCLPGVALLVGMALIRLTRTARDPARSASTRVAAVLLGVQWLSVLLAGILTPLLSGNYLTAPDPTTIVVLVAAVTCGVVLSLVIWRRGNDVLALVPITAACAVGALIGYGILAPADNPARGHRQLALQLEHRLPPSARSLHFFHEIDEGLWFYLGNRRLVPVPGSQPRYSDSFDKVGNFIATRFPFGAASDPSMSLLDRQKLGLIDWLRNHGSEKPFLLIRTALYDRMAADLVGLVTPLYQEEGLKRNTLTLLQVNDEHRLTAAPW